MIKNIVAYSLWGDHPMYWVGALKNIEQVKNYFPSWVCRFYIDDTCDEELIKKIKGEKRPINDISERCDFLLNLNVVDHVVVFNDDTPYNIINLIKPKTLVKGGDYNHHTIIGAELVENVLIYEYIKNKSSTSVINKILENNNL